MGVPLSRESRVLTGPDSVMVRAFASEAGGAGSNPGRVIPGSEVAEWLAHWLLVLEVPGSIPAGGEENLLVRTCFPSCHLQE